MSSRFALIVIAIATLGACTVSIGPQARTGYGPHPSYSQPPPPPPRAVQIIEQRGPGWSLTFNTGNGQCDWRTEPGGTLDQGRERERQANQACDALGHQHGFRYN